MDPAQALEAAEMARNSIIDEETACGDSPVQRFYSGAVVMVTGGSGFLGKQLVEKLFRSCNIAKLYILLRVKKKKSIQERLEIFLNDPVFTRLHNIKPNFVNKIIPVVGDVTMVKLGLSRADWTELTNEVTDIFHGAAAIAFTEPLKQATLTNVKGTCEMLSLGRACKNLRSFVYISTAYTHATKENINQTVYEQFYTSPLSPKILIEMADKLNSDTLDKITSILLNNWPNTYSFTKAVAEEAVRSIGADLPICIVRPAVVMGALLEPTPGWVEPSCIKGPSGIILGVSLGGIHALFMDPNIHLDLVPVDITNNAIIVAAKETYHRKQRGEMDIKIYTVTGSRNPIHFGYVRTVQCELDLLSDKVIWHSYVFTIKLKVLFWLAHWTLHLIPAYFADFVLRLLGKRPKAVKFYQLLSTLTKVYDFFTFNEWTFDDRNLCDLYLNLSPADRIIFNCNSLFDWRIFIKLWNLGLRRYVLKDNLNKTKLGIKKHKWFRVANIIVLPVYFYVLCRILYILIIFIVTIMKMLLNLF